MPLLEQKGSELTITTRKGCDYPFVLNLVGSFDLTDATAVMHINYEDAVQHEIPLTVYENSRTIAVLISNALTTVMPLKSRHLILLTAGDGLIYPLAYGTITTLDEPL